VLNRWQAKLTEAVVHRHAVDVAERVVARLGDGESVLIYGPPSVGLAIRGQVHCPRGVKVEQADASKPGPDGGRVADVVVVFHRLLTLPKDQATALLGRATAQSRRVVFVADVLSDGVIGEFWMRNLAPENVRKRLIVGEGELDWYRALPRDAGAELEREEFGLRRPMDVSERLLGRSAYFATLRPLRAAHPLARPAA
jgi:hypothetical protein